MAIDIHRVDQAEFDSLREKWNSLLARSAADNFFLRWEWIHTWWSVFNRDRTLCVLAATLNGQLIGIAPFYVTRPGRWAKARVLRFCSDELSPDYMDFIIEKEQEKDVLKAFLGYWDGEDTFDVMALDDLLKESVVMRHVALFSPWVVRERRLLKCPYIPVEGPYDTYMQERQRVAKISEKEFRKKKEKLVTELGVTHVVIGDQSLLPKAVDDLFQLHAKRSDDKGIETNFASDSVKEFHLQLSRRLLPEGILNMQFLYQGEKPLSVDYMFQYRNKLYCYQKGMDPEWSKLSVGTILLHDIIKQAFAVGLAEVDFLKGEERYKNAWTNRYREEWGLRVYRKTWRGRLLHQFHWRKDWAKSVVKSDGTST